MIHTIENIGIGLYAFSALVLIGTIVQDMLKWGGDEGQGR